MQTSVGKKKKIDGTVDRDRRRERLGERERVTENT